MGTRGGRSVRAAPRLCQPCARGQLPPRTPRSPRSARPRGDQALLEGEERGLRPIPAEGPPPPGIPSRAALTRANLREAGSQWAHCCFPAAKGKLRGLSASPEERAAGAPRGLAGCRPRAPPGGRGRNFPCARGVPAGGAAVGASKTRTGKTPARRAQRPRS